MRILDKILKEYNRKKMIFGMPGWVLMFISVSILVAGIIAGVKAITAIGVLLIAIAVFFVVMAKVAKEAILEDK